MELNAARLASLRPEALGSHSRRKVAAMRIRRTLLPGLGLLLATTTLAGCDMDENTNGEDLTPPGTQLHLGEAATVPTADRGVIKLTVDEIEKAPHQELVGVEGYDPTTDVYFVRYQVEVVSEGDEADPVHGEIGIGSLDILGAIGGRTASDSSLPLAPGRPAECPDNGDLAHDPEPGQRFSMCSPQEVPKGQVVVAVESNEGSAAYDPVEGGEPVVWKP